MTQPRFDADRLLHRVLVPLPFVLLGLATGLAVLSPGQTGRDRLGTLILAATAAVWALSMYTLRSPTWTRRTGPMLVYVAGQLALAGVLMARQPIFLLFAVIGFMQAYEVLPPVWAFASILATSILINLIPMGVPTGTSWLTVVIAVICLQTLLVGWFGYLGYRAHAQSEQLHAAIAQLRSASAENAGLHAQLVAQAREAGVHDERQRLAREIHDGIAQEIASLGYVVDHMASSTRDPAVAQGLRDLRGELSRVVADLRLSIFDLRSDVSATNGLGSALSEYVRQVGAKSDLTVHLTLNEAPTRLSPSVEGELLRIAQEAVTNARKHASAQNLWVHCWTSPPQASLTVRDDGRGINGRRDDSYGISIMRERANRIDATLEISTETAGDVTQGTVVTVKVAQKHALTAERR
jgi:signal transduction histidine kinase